MEPREDAIRKLVAALRETFASGRTRSLDWRLSQLAGLRALVVEREGELLDALAADLGKGAVEAWVTELGLVIAEIDFARRRLARWMRPIRVSPSLPQLPGRARVERIPYGVVLVIAPWNYPLNLTLAPLVGALAAGNCVVLKPSERAPASAAALARLLPEYVDGEACRVVEGDADVARALVDAPVDLVFFTGGETVGRQVLTAAAAHLTPVLLELGGKSPCIVLGDADLETTARRVVWGKFVNAGQTCVAPDHVLVERAVERPLLDALARAVEASFGGEPAASADYGRIVDERHHARLVALLAGGTPVCGGAHDVGDRYLAPTVLTDVDPGAALMQEEIFGPLLPVLPVADADAAVRFVGARPRPLALYVFTGSTRAARRVLDGTASGGACVNDVLLHLANPRLPFGGIGPSGHGSYHGRAGFEAFSHPRSVLARGTWIDPSLRYPPHDDRKRSLLRRLFSPFG